MIIYNNKNQTPFAIPIKKLGEKGVVVFDDVENGDTFVLDRSIYTLNLPPRDKNTIYRAHIITIRDLTEITESRLSSLSGIEAITVYRVKEALKELGLSMKQS